MTAYRLASDALDLVAAYQSDLWDIGQLPDQKVLWGARWFLVHVGQPQAFAELPLDQQLAVNSAVHRFIAWLIASRRLRPSADYLVARRPRLGISLSRHWPVFHALFMNTAATLAFPVKAAQV
jgi:hypothetical protein